MSDFFGTLKKRKSNEPSGTTSPRSSLDSGSRKSVDASNEDPMPDPDEKIDELFEQMLVLIEQFTIFDIILTVFRVVEV